MNIEQMNTIVETIVNECESIISETENITEVVDLESFAEELLEIRISAEELQTLILNIEESEYILLVRLINILIVSQYLFL